MLDELNATAVVEPKLDAARENEVPTSLNTSEKSLASNTDTKFPRPLYEACTKSCMTPSKPRIWIKPKTWIKDTRVCWK